MYSLNYLKDLVTISDSYNVDLIPLHNTLESKVSQYMKRDRYQDNLFRPPTKYYERAINVMKEYYKRKSVKEE